MNLKFAGFVGFIAALPQDIVNQPDETATLPPAACTDLSYCSLLEAEICDDPFHAVNCRKMCGTCDSEITIEDDTEDAVCEDKLGWCVPELCDVAMDQNLEDTFKATCKKTCGLCDEVQDDVETITEIDDLTEDDMASVLNAVSEGLACKDYLPDIPDKNCATMIEKSGPAFCLNPGLNKVCLASCDLCKGSTLDDNELDNVIKNTIENVEEVNNQTTDVVAEPAVDDTNEADATSEDTNNESEDSASVEVTEENAPISNEDEATEAPAVVTDAQEGDASDPTEAPIETTTSSSNSMICSIVVVVVSLSLI